MFVFHVYTIRMYVTEKHENGNEISESNSQILRNI